MFSLGAGLILSENRPQMEKKTQMEAQFVNLDFYIYKLKHLKLKF